MGYNMYEFETDKVSNIAENLEKGIRYIGKAMQVADEICNGGEMGYRSGSGMGYRNYANRSGYRTGMGFREEEQPEYDDFGNPIGMRRMRDSRGRYM